MVETIVLVGNPNVGKSVIFGRLTGTYAVVSNYPGTTVDISRGAMTLAGRRYEVIDTPGTDALLPSSEDEQVTRDVIMRVRPAAVIQVADAKNLRRALLLTFELIECGVPLILALNMHDEAVSRGIRIDAPRLENILGVPVIATIGITGEGIPELKKRLPHARHGNFNATYPPEIERLLTETAAGFGAPAPCARAAAAMLVSGDRTVFRYVAGALPDGFIGRLERKVADFVRPPRLLIFETKNMYAAQITGEVITSQGTPAESRLARLGALCMRPFPGYLIVLAVLFIMYEFVGVFAAGTLVNLLENHLFGRYVIPLAGTLINGAIPSEIVREFLMGPYGLVSMALTYAAAIVLPVVAAFFLFFGLLEDSGYLPRLSVMLDRLFRTFGLNGKAVLPMVLGLGCGTMAALGTRILETRKERLLALLLLSLTIPCSAQLGIILGLLAGLSWQAGLIWFVSITGSLVAVGAAANRVLPGHRSPFILEIPPLRRPDFGNVVTKVKMRLVWYVKEAVPLFALGTAILFFSDKLHMLSVLERVARPVVVSAMGLPAQVTPTFILGFLRRDYGAAGLFVMAQDGLLDARQVVVSAVAITLFIPCVAQCFVVIREQGMKIAIALFAFVIIYAIGYSSLLNMVLKTFHPLILAPLGRG